MEIELSLMAEGRTRAEAASEVRPQLLFLPSEDESEELPPLPEPKPGADDTTTERP